MDLFHLYSNWLQSRNVTVLNFKYYYSINDGRLFLVPTRLHIIEPLSIREVATELKITEGHGQ